MAKISRVALFGKLDPPGYKAQWENPCQGEWRHCDEGVEDFAELMQHA